MCIRDRLRDEEGRAWWMLTTLTDQVLGEISHMRYIDVYKRQGSQWISLAARHSGPLCPRAIPNLPDCFWKKGLAIARVFRLLDEEIYNVVINLSDEMAHIAKFYNLKSAS